MYVYSVAHNRGKYFSRRAREIRLGGEIMSGNTSKIDENNAQDCSLTEKQDARSFLRERFLRAITGLAGQKAEFEMFDNTKVSAQFHCCDIDVQNIAVSGLSTPLGVIPHAVLRTNDVYSIKFPDLKDIK